MDQKQSDHRFLIRLHFFLAIILLLHSVLFLIYWFAVTDFRLEVDQMLAAQIEWHLPYSIIFMGLTILIILWSLFRVVKFGFAIKRGNWKPNIKNWLFFATCLLFLVIFYGSFWLILRENQSQKGVIIHLLNIIRLFSDGLILLIVAILLRRLIKFVKGKLTDDKKRWPLTVTVILALLVLIGLWLVPTIFPPNWAFRGDLPTKPAIIAEGGAAMLAPENTLAAVELAEVHNAFGFETTVRISEDGIPFLMHDETLARTTNIAEVYPERENDLASSFDSEELESFNAGLWFIQTDPYDTINGGDISQTQLSINQGQRIPTLAEALKVIADQDMIVLLHLRRPPEDHPYYDQFFETVLSVCQESELNDDIWLDLDTDQLKISQAESPQITRILEASSQDMPKAAVVSAEGYEIVHVDTGISLRSIRALRSEGLGVNVQTINQPWLFSQFWLSGVTSISTTNIQTLSELEKPFINLPYPRFLLIWGVLGIVLAFWLATNFPLPVRKVAQEKTPLAPQVPVPGSVDQIPADSAIATSPSIEPLEEQGQEDGFVKEAEKPLGPDQLLPISEHLAQAAQGEETTAVEEALNTFQENELDSTSPAQNLAAEIEEKQEEGAGKQSMGTWNAEFIQSDGQESEKTPDSDDNLDADEADQTQMQ